MSVRRQLAWRRWFAWRVDGTVRCREIGPSADAADVAQQQGTDDYLVVNAATSKADALRQAEADFEARRRRLAHPVRPLFPSSH